MYLKEEVEWGSVGTGSWLPAGTSSSQCPWATWLTALARNLAALPWQATRPCLGTWNPSVSQCAVRADLLSGDRMFELWKLWPVGRAEAKGCSASTLWPAVGHCDFCHWCLSTVGLCECSDTAMHPLIACLLSQLSFCKTSAVGSTRQGKCVYPSPMLSSQKHA